MVFKKWEDICKPWDAGGFNVKDLATWNVALLCKWLFLLSSPNSGIWATWYQHYVVASENIWNVQTKASYSTSFKGILKVKDKLLSLAGSIQAAADLLQSWAGGPKFNLGLAYGCLRNVSALGDWTISLMHNRIMPTHRIICSLAVQQHLATIDNLQVRGIQLANRCSLCQNGLESHDHLFFKCDYSAAVWDRLLQWMGSPHLSYALVTILENSGATGKHCRWEHA
ncbi:uncharacterized protein LOC141588245 [Silene latifolia]|uniref:uncharacterized protein LOC141588245 n=1 Tax=Silene latifolia TaxID=37657 RepID=UPI003D788D9E